MGKTILFFNSVTFIFLKLLELLLVLVFSLSIPVFTDKKSPWTQDTERVKLTLHTLYNAQVLFGSSLWERAASEWLNGAKYRIFRLFRASKERYPWGRSYCTLWHRGLLSWASHQWTILTYLYLSDGEGQAGGWDDCLMENSTYIASWLFCWIHEFCCVHK